jgi:hypothetical protein
MNMFGQSPAEGANVKSLLDGYIPNPWVIYYDISYVQCRWINGNYSEMAINKWWGNNQLALSQTMKGCLRHWHQVNPETGMRPSAQIYVIIWLQN